jgi:hypothetical protein
LALAQASLESFHLGIQLYILGRSNISSPSLFELDPITGIILLKALLLDPLGKEAPEMVEQ